MGRGRPKKENAPTMTERANKWNKENTIAITIRFNKHTQQDVLKKLSEVNNKTQYIIDLIKKDLGQPKQETITLSDLSKMMVDGEKAVLEFEEGKGVISVWHASKHEIENDTRIVKDYFRDNDNRLIALVKPR